MKLFIILLALVIFAPIAHADFKDISVKNARELISENSGNVDFVILDIRTPSEFRSGSIPNAINIDFRGADFAKKLSELDINKTYLVYCQSANRSTRAMPIFRELGFQNVYNMMGGYSRF
jgi:rhodanese-related sulfurtransferase